MPPSCSTRGNPKPSSSTGQPANFPQHALISNHESTPPAGKMFTYDGVLYAPVYSLSTPLLTSTTTPLPPADPSWPLDASAYTHFVESTPLPVTQFCSYLTHTAPLPSAYIEEIDENSPPSPLDNTSVDWSLHPTAYTALPSSLSTTTNPSFLTVAPHVTFRLNALIFLLSVLSLPTLLLG